MHASVVYELRKKGTHAQHVGYGAACTCKKTNMLRVKKSNLFKLLFSGVGVVISAKHISPAPKWESSSTVELQIGETTTPEWIWRSWSSAKHALSILLRTTSLVSFSPLWSIHYLEKSQCSLLSSVLRYKHILCQCHYRAYKVKIYNILPSKRSNCHCINYKSSSITSLLQKANLFRLGSFKKWGNFFYSLKKRPLPSLLSFPFLSSPRLLRRFPGPLPSSPLAALLVVSRAGVPSL
jgi:hypothetical protein